MTRREVAMYERRFMKGECEVRSSPEGPLIAGYAAVFDSMSIR